MSRNKHKPNQCSWLDDNSTIAINSEIEVESESGVAEQFIVKEFNNHGIFVSLPNAKPSSSANIVALASVLFGGKKLKKGDVVKVSGPRGLKLDAEVLLILKNGFLYLRPVGAKGRPSLTDFLKISFIK